MPNMQDLLLSWPLGIKIKAQPTYREGKMCLAERIPLPQLILGLGHSVLFIHRFEKLMKVLCMRLVKSGILLGYVHDLMVCSEAAVILDILFCCPAEVIHYPG